MLVLMWYCLTPFQYRIKLGESDLGVHRLFLCPFVIRIRDIGFGGHYYIWSSLLAEDNSVICILFVVDLGPFNDTRTTPPQPDLEGYSERQLLFSATKKEVQVHPLSIELSYGRERRVCMESTNTLSFGFQNE
jgi:hypothetical protein